MYIIAGILEALVHFCPYTKYCMAYVFIFVWFVNSATAIYHALVVGTVFIAGDYNVFSNISNIIRSSPTHPSASWSAMCRSVLSVTIMVPSEMRNWTPQALRNLTRSSVSYSPLVHETSLDISGLYHIPKALYIMFLNVSISSNVIEISHTTLSIDLHFSLCVYTYMYIKLVQQNK